ncbi:hypothetical protein LIER_37685 [Lithospermum erythrorhizon]|uniref:PPIase cyclophilin-type domain-containing protein n=1 Tax=Lithospermum erythrorhizon TaxID=34254 RepID=A0AAV3PQX1_LITER
MRRKPNASESNPKCVHLIILLLGLLSCGAVYMSMSRFNNHGNINVDKIGTLSNLGGENVQENEGRCRGVERLELWGKAVKWGSEFKVNSPQECCKACQDMCNNGPCLCDTWVFCSNRSSCGDRFGECWLKKQDDTMVPERQEAGEVSMWTSGLVVGKGEGIIGLETEYGTLHITLFPTCSPHSFLHILELLRLRHCAGCHIFRAESRGQSWDSQGNHIKDSSYGPPYALIQGTLEVQGLEFQNIPNEFQPSIKRGSVAWVGSGPEFFISLANHDEWKGTYTVFGTVRPEDMAIADRIAELPTKPDVWEGIHVSVLKRPVPLKFHRIN